MTELVAGKAENDEALVLVLTVELLEPLVLGRKTALARDVHDEKGFSLVRGELLFLAIDGFGLEIVDAHAADSSRKDVGSL
jgi:hypothetical protein